MDDETQTFFDSLPQDLKEYINDTDQDELRAEIDEFFDEYGNSQENKDSMTQVIENFISFNKSDYPGKNDGLPFEWWNDDYFILNSGNFDMDEGAPNAKEVALFAIHPEAALLHVENSNVASSKARQLVIDSTLTGINNGKADAFRHAAWNAMGTAEFGSGTMKSFADAHEWNKSGLDVDMDYFNNHKGRGIGSSFGFMSSDNSIFTSVLASLLNGGLQYLSPLGPNGSILSSTIPIPTNQ